MLVIVKRKSLTLFFAVSSSRSLKMLRNWQYYLLMNELCFNFHRKYVEIFFLKKNSNLMESILLAIGLGDRSKTETQGNLWGPLRVANFQTLVWDLRFFVILQTFLLLSYICLKPRLFCISYHKTTSKHSIEFKNFDSILQKNSVTLDKNGKSAPTQLAPPVPG